MGVFPSRKLTDGQEREVAELYSQTATPLVEIGRRFGIGQTSVARIAQRRGAALRSPNISRSMASGKQSAVADASANPQVDKATPSPPEVTASPPPAASAAPEMPASPTPAPKPPVIKRRASPPAGRTRAPRAAARAVPAEGGSRQFAVSFVADQVLQAETMWDAIRQAEALGATEIMSIVLVK
jgi:hypothetical protein